MFYTDEFMKESRFNYFSKDGDYVICMNGTSGNIFSIPQDTYKLLKDILAEPMKEGHDNDLVSSLYELHFLIDDDFDEIDHLRKRYKTAVNNGNYHLIINPTQECNFRCWYCYENHTCGHMTIETMERIKMLANKIADRNDISSFELSWFGGEPLLYFDEVVYPLARYIKQVIETHGKSFINTMTSNGYFLTEKVIEKSKEIALASIQVTLDGNREMHDRTRNNQGAPSFDRILDNIVNYCSYDANNSVILRINYTDEVIRAGLKDVFVAIPSNIRPQIKVNFQRVWQTIGVEKSEEALQEHLDYIKELGYPDVNNSSYAMFYGRKCYADSTNYANINYDGNVFRCTARDYDPKQRLGYLNECGEIVWTHKELMEKLNAMATFENEMCLKCKKLAICGGLCFGRRWDMLTGNQKTVCIKPHLDTGIGRYLKDYYDMRQRRRNELRKLHKL